MSSPPIIIEPDSSVSNAMKLMRRRNIHSLIVDLSAENFNPPYGIITTTDINEKIVGAERNPATLTVREIMTAPVITGKSEWTLKECSELMQKNRFHHLPITDEKNNLVGIISTTDIFAAVEDGGWDKKHE
jgi:CBS domain-containing protein